MVRVKRKPNETAASLIRRFSSYVRMSGVLKESRKRQYRTEKLSERQKKDRALRRLRRQQEEKR